MEKESFLSSVRRLAREIWKRYAKFFILGGIFVATSALLYYIHYRTFHDLHHIFIYMVGDLAFLPLEAFIVVVVIERIFAYREKRAMLSKLNMVIGAFFSELGNRLLEELSTFCRKREDVINCLGVKQEWTVSDFKAAHACAREIKTGLGKDCKGLKALRVFLLEKRGFLLKMLENPNLMEHDRFTDLMWAVIHLVEELEARQSLDNLPDEDREHLAGDMQRVYGRLAGQWLDYLEHLKSNYPYLFSLVLRIHPFQDKPSPIVGGG